MTRARQLIEAEDPKDFFRDLHERNYFDEWLLQNFNCGKEPDTTTWCIRRFPCVAALGVHGWLWLKKCSDHIKFEVEMDDPGTERQKVELVPIPDHAQEKAIDLFNWAIDEIESKAMVEREESEFAQRRQFQRYVQDVFYDLKHSLAGLGGA